MLFFFQIFSPFYLTVIIHVIYYHYFKKRNKKLSVIFGSSGYIISCIYFALGFITNLLLFPVCSSSHTASLRCIVDSKIAANIFFVYKKEEFVLYKTHTLTVVPQLSFHVNTVKEFPFCFFGSNKVSLCCDKSFARGILVYQLPRTHRDVITLEKKIYSSTVICPKLWKI